MSKEFAIVDTSFLIGLLDSKDSLHQKAEKLMSKLINLELIFTDVVYGETLSVLSRRIRERRKGISNWKEVFLKTVKEMDHIAGNNLLYIMPMVKEKFFEIKKICIDSVGEINFNDALLIVGANEYGIEQIVSFDPDFDRFLKRIGDSSI